MRRRYASSSSGPLAASLPGRPGAARPRCDRCETRNQPSRRETPGLQRAEVLTADLISFRLNGKPVQLEIDGDRTLLWVLRTDLGLTGTRYGCGESLCGACTVVVGREARREEGRSPRLHPAPRRRDHRPLHTDLSELFGQEARTRGYPTDFNAYLRIAGDGRVTVYSGKIEMGQGVVTSLAQMAADELEVSFDSMDMVLGDTALCPFDNGTYGSMSTRFFGPALRAAAAEAVLVALAAEQLKAPPDALGVQNGVVSVAAEPKRRVTFGELAKGQKIVRRLDGKAVTKSVSEFHVMGRPEKRRDARAKVTGMALYAGDVRLPGMLYAKVLRPPAHGATLRGVDTSAVAALPGLVVVNESGLVASGGDGEEREKKGYLVEGEKSSASLFTSDRRMRGVPLAAAERFGWKKAASPSGRGVGVA